MYSKNGHICINCTEMIVEFLLGIVCTEKSEDILRSSRFPISFFIW